MDTFEHIGDRLAEGRSASVCGMGISNLPLIDFLLERGVRVVARDQKTRDKLDVGIVEQLEQKGVKLVLGEGYLEDISEDIVFRTPSMRPDRPELRRASERGSIISSEMELFFELTQAHIIGITGSDGKTTTSTLTYKMLEKHCAEKGAGRVFLGGNIGNPLLPLVGGMTRDDYAVVELSSFQLMTLRRSPEIAAITNITPNHLNWHNGFGEYAEAKKNICRGVGCRRLTVNADNAETARIGAESELDVAFFSSRYSRYEDIVPTGKRGSRAFFVRDGKVIMSDGEREDEVLEVERILLPGRHNIENYMTAISNCFDIVSKDAIASVAQSFGGVEHRLEFVRELDGVKYYNSSIDSTPTRTAAALSALSVKPVIICGGADKKVPFAPLAETLAGGTVGVVLTGATAGAIRSALTGYDPDIDSRLPIEMAEDFEEAVLKARKMARRGGAVLLSPACTSYDRFKNFEERGRVFKEIVNNLK